ncbi:hypothetical protein ACFQVA_34455 [Actinomadura keratinilytica]
MSSTGPPPPASSSPPPPGAGYGTAPRTGRGQSETVRRVKEAWEAKDIAALVDLLDPSAVMTADGGGLAAPPCAPWRAAPISPGTWPASRTGPPASNSWNTRSTAPRAWSPAARGPS